MVPSHEDRPVVLSFRRSAQRSVERLDARSRRRRRTRGLVAAWATLPALLLASSGVAVGAGSGASSMVLRPGSGGPPVAALQQALGIPADGVYGPQTARAVRRLQRRRGLAQDGVAGASTLSAAGVSGAVRRSARQTAGGEAGAGAASPTLQRIARCESGGDPSRVSAGGEYRGKYQFSLATWRSLGGVGDPAQAPEAVQDRIAAKLLAAQGTSPWPSC